MPIITSVTSRFNSTTLAVALCRAGTLDGSKFPLGGRRFENLTEAEVTELIDVVQEALDNLVQEGVLGVGQ
jgi:hypothetical protein